MASHIEKNNIKPPNIKGCISTSELLTKEYRNKIESVFKCKIIDAYGAGDGGVTAFKHDNNFEVSYNCLLDTDNKISSGSGLLYSTDLLNFSFPFIRYEIGDSAEISYEKNYNGQVIKQLYGRTPNIIKLENGRILIAPAFTVLFSGLNVKAYRILKTSSNLIEIHVVKEKNYSNNNELKILKSFKFHAGNNVKIDIKYFDSFKLPNSGKRNYFIS